MSGHKGTNKPHCNCPALWSLPQPASGTGSHFSRQGRRSLSQCWSPAPHSTALPGHGPHQAGPTCGPTSQPMDRPWIPHLRPPPPPGGAQVPRRGRRGGAPRRRDRPGVELLCPCLSSHSMGCSRTEHCAELIIITMERGLFSVTELRWLARTPAKGAEVGERQLGVLSVSVLGKRRGHPRNTISDCCQTTE